MWVILDIWGENMKLVDALDNQLLVYKTTTKITWYLWSKKSYLPPCLFCGGCCRCCSSLILISEHIGEFFGDFLRIANFRLDLVQESRQVFPHRRVCPPEEEVRELTDHLAVSLIITGDALFEASARQFSVLSELPLLQPVYCHVDVRVPGARSRCRCTTHYICAYVFLVLLKISTGWHITLIKTSRWH